MEKPLLKLEMLRCCNKSLVSLLILFSISYGMNAQIKLRKDKRVLFKANKTFDIGENTKIGKYIRSIFNDPQFSKSPIDVSFGPNAYTYFNGVSVKDGIYTRKGEILSSYYTGDSSDKMMDFESYVTSGFSRNGIIAPNLLNLEFLFKVYFVIGRRCSGFW